LCKFSQAASAETRDLSHMEGTAGSPAHTEPISTGRQVTAAEDALTEPPGPTARAAPQLTDHTADSEHRSHLCPEPDRPAHARRSARRCYPAVPQRRPQPVGRGSHRPAAPPGRRPRHPPSLAAVAANSFVFGGNPGYAHPAILTHQTLSGLDEYWSRWRHRQASARKLHYPAAPTSWPSCTPAGHRHGRAITAVRAGRKSGRLAGATGSSTRIEAHDTLLRWLSSGLGGGQGGPGPVRAGASSPAARAFSSAEDHQARSSSMTCRRMSISGSTGRS
jgi:hypothetical protein